MRPTLDSMSPMKPLVALPWQQLCNVLVTYWWRIPDDYKRELCAIFATPLGPANTPLCSLLCDNVRTYQIRLASCIAFELHRFHTRLLGDGWARFQLQGQLQSISDKHPQKSILFGFMLPLEYWLQSKDLFTNPAREADNDLFVAYSLALSTTFPGIDYLALLLAPSTANAEDKMRRK